MNFLSHLECPRCRQQWPADRTWNTCECGAPLLVRYDLEGARRVLSRDHLASRQADMWRYRELLPVRKEENITTLGEGFTPLLRLSRLGAAMGVELLLKDEGQNPTGTFKARGAACGISRAWELGIRKVALPTAGNAGAAWASYAARRGMECLVVMPEDAPELTKKECSVAGAQVITVPGLISDAAKVVAHYVRSRGYFDVSTLREPYRIEGKKTMGYEIAEQVGWKLPDVIVYPTGGGVGLIGMWKAFQEMKQLRWLEGPLPRMVAVQAAGCAPIVLAHRQGREESDYWAGAHTVAAGIRVPKALGDFLVLQALRASGGTAVAVEDEEILYCVQELAAREGVYVCPEGAACLAAIRKLRERQWLREGETVLLLNTGSGLKYPELVQATVTPHESAS